MVLDYTNIDKNRRELSYQGYHYISRALPEYFIEKYPKLITLLEKYYQFMDSDESPSRLIHELFYTRDITQVDESILNFIEDELLLGQSYFGGFQNKRDASKFSNTLYKSKGTLYSIQQFFRMFFGIDPEVIYTKDQVFTVGVDHIGPEDRKFIIDDKLYQNFALLIKTPLPASEWLEAYKLFVHPAGMYIGSEVQIISTFDRNLNAEFMPIETSVTVDPRITGITETFAIQPVTDITGLKYINGSTDSETRIDLTRVIEDYQVITLAQIESQYDNMAEFVGTNSPTYDEDSAVGDASAPRMSSDLDRMDEVNYVWYDSDSA